MSCTRPERQLTGLSCFEQGSTSRGRDGEGVSERGCGDDTVVVVVLGRGEERRECIQDTMR